MSHSQTDLTIEEKIGQLFFIGIPGPTVDEQTADLLKVVQPGGVCFFARNIREAPQTRQLSDEIRERSKVTPFLSLDQEGGLVDRLRRLILPMPAANQIPDAESAARYGSIVAEVLRILGFNMDFAPVVDVITDERETASNGLFSRGFGRSAEQTTEFSGSFLAAIQQGGCLGCIKHFPGLGASTVDSHEELPHVDVSTDELNAIDLLPYRRLFERKIAHVVMVAHAAYPNTGLQERGPDGKLLPSSLSRSIITGLLRSELGFDRLVITDDLEMGAIVKNFGIGEACIMAFEAGADMLAICADPKHIIEGRDSLLTALQSERISESRVEDSIRRVNEARSLLAEPLPFERARIAELSDAIAVLAAELN